MIFWQFFRKGWDGHALLVQPFISAHRKWPEMVVPASTNQLKQCGILRKVISNLVLMVGNRIKSTIAFAFLVFETVFDFDVECIVSNICHMRWMMS